MRKTLLLAGVVAGGLALSPPAGAVLLTFGTIGSGATDDGNDGTFDTLTPNDFRTGVDLSGSPFIVLAFRFALEFDLSSLPAGGTVNAASLRLRTVDDGAAGSTTLAGYVGDGAITLADMTAGTDILSFTPPNTFPNNYDVSGFIQGFYAGSGDWAGFNVRQNPAGSVFTPWDGTPNPSSPLLTIDFTPAATSVPEPSGLALAGLGAVLLPAAAWGRRRPARV